MNFEVSEEEIKVEKKIHEERREKSSLEQVKATTIEKITELQPSSTEPKAIFKIPTKITEVPRKFQIIVPYLETIHPRFIKSILIPVRVGHVGIITLNIAISQAMFSRSMGISVLTPLTFFKAVVPPPSLKVKVVFNNIAIESAIHSERLCYLGFQVPKIKTKNFRFKRPIFIPTHEVQRPDLRFIKLAMARETKAIELDPYSPRVFGLPEGLLDERSKIAWGGPLSSIMPESFVCIIAEKTREFNELIELLCSILYRIKSPGPPDVWKQTRPSETFLESKMKEDITIVDEVAELIATLISRIKSGADIQKQKQMKEFIDRIKGLRLEQKFRFLVLPVEKEDIDLVEEVFTHPNQDFRYHIPVLHIYRLREIEDEKLAMILRVMFGFLEPLPYSHSIGRQCLELEKQFSNQLRKIMETVKRRVHLLRQPRAGDEIGQKESVTHYVLKFLVMKHFIDNVGIPEDAIRTEEGIYGGRIRPDISVDERISVEIETFFGTIYPLEKLTSKLKRYLDVGFKGELMLVVPNIQALLYVDDLLKLRKDYQNSGLNIEVYTLDLTGRGSKILYDKDQGPGLIRLTDVLEWLAKSDLGRHEKFLKLGLE